MAGRAKLAGAKPRANQFREFQLPLAVMRTIDALEVANAMGCGEKPLSM